MSDAIFDSTFEICLDAASRTQQGYLMIGGFNAGTGVLVYNLADGTQRRELRTIKELKASLSSMAALPVTGGHPVEVVDGEMKQVLLTQKNTARHQKGYYADKPELKGELTYVKRVITDPVLDGEIMQGLRNQISMGYKRYYIEGAHPDYPNMMFNGEKYDGYQTNIEWNHDAIVQRARGGARLRVIFDSKNGDENAIFDSSEIEVNELNNNLINKDEVKSKKMANYCLDGKDFEVSDSVAVALKYFEENKKRELDTLKAERDGFQARFDEVNTQLTEAKKIDHNAARQALRQLERKAEKVLGKDFSFDGLDEQGIKSAVIAKQRPQLSLTDKSATYIDVAFDSIMEALPAAPVVNPGSRGFSPGYQAAYDSFTAPPGETVRGQGVNMDAKDDPVGAAMVNRSNYYSESYKNGVNQ